MSPIGPLKEEPDKQKKKKRNDEGAKSQEFLKT